MKYSALALEWSYIYLVSYKWISNTVPYPIAEDHWSAVGRGFVYIAKLLCYTTLWVKNFLYQAHCTVIFHGHNLSSLFVDLLVFKADCPFHLQISFRSIYKKWLILIKNYQRKVLLVQIKSSYIKVHYLTIWCCYPVEIYAGTMDASFITHVIDHTRASVLNASLTWKQKGILTSVQASPA